MLTPKQEKFAQVYVETGNASEAYRQAYNTKNCTRNTLDVEAWKCVNNPKISQRISELKARQLQKHDVTIERVVNEYRKLAFLDPRKAFDQQGNLKPIHELDDDTAAAVAGMEVEEVFSGTGTRRKVTGQIRKIKLSDKIRSLDSLAKHLGMFIERVEVTGSLDLAARLTAARKRKGNG